MLRLALVFPTKAGLSSTLSRGYRDHRGGGGFPYCNAESCPLDGNKPEIPTPPWLPYPPVRASTCSLVPRLLSTHSSFCRLHHRLGTRLIYMYLLAENRWTLLSNTLPANPSQPWKLMSIPDRPLGLIMKILPNPKAETRTRYLARIATLRARSSPLLYETPRVLVIRRIGLRLFTT